MPNELVPVISPYLIINAKEHKLIWREKKERNKELFSLRINYYGGKRKKGKKEYFVVQNKQNKKNRQKYILHDICEQFFFFLNSKRKRKKDKTKSEVKCERRKGKKKKKMKRGRNG